MLDILKRKNWKFKSETYRLSYTQCCRPQQELTLCLFQLIATIIGNKDYYSHFANEVSEKMKRL
jgi:hypothetical protein